MSREELDWWAGELGRDLRDGQFGENLTTEGLDVDGSVLGERWRVGTALLEVCGPRIPCATFAAWMDERQWVRRFSERGRTGAYLAVIEPGTMTAGDRIEVVRRPEGGVGVTEVFRALMGDPEAARRVLDAEELGADDRAELEASLTRRAPRPTDP